MVIDKPAGMTSHDVVGGAVKKATPAGQPRGTLTRWPPGLVIGIERATKTLGLLTAAPAPYAATHPLGSDHFHRDAEGQVLQSVPAKHLTIEAIDAATERLRGEIRQAVVGQRDQGRWPTRLSVDTRQGRSVQLKPGRSASTEMSLAARRRPAHRYRCGRSTALGEPTSARWHSDLGDALGVEAM